MQGLLTGPMMMSTDMSVEDHFRYIGCHAWIPPCRALDDLQYRLSYETCTPAELAYAVAVIADYKALIYESSTRRNAIIQELRKGPGKTE